MSERNTKIKYDKVDQQYGLMLGKSKLVFIKTGAAGSIYGYKNKYLELASKIQNERGYAVVVSANPVGSPLNLQEELEKASTYLIDVKEIILIGISRGGLLVLQQGYLNTKVSRILAINPPLAINWHKTKKGIINFSGAKVQVVFGQSDPSVDYSDLIERLEILETDCSSQIISKADHNFKGKLDTFKKLVMQFVLED